MTPPPIPDIESLLAHAGWIRSLARHLVADASTADDLVQKTWVAALEHPPAEGTPVKRWLGAVVRNFARQDRRGNARRLARESSTARAEASPSAGEMAETVAVQRELLDAVLALPEPYRETIVQRFYEGLPPREIARRHGIPVKTAKTRIARALDQLRATFDRRHGGRKAWLGAVLPIAMSAPSTGFGVIASTEWKLVAAVAAALVAGGVVWRVASFRADPPPAIAIGTRLSREAPVEVSSSAPAPSSSDRTPVDTSGAETPTSRTANPVEDELAEIRGRLLRPEGRPASGVAVELSGHSQTATTQAWEDARTASDADGRFSIRFQPPSRFQYSLVVTFGEGCTERWSWIDIRPGEVEDLGEVSLRRGGDLVGRVVDAQGNPSPGPWRVLAQGPMHPEDPAKEAPSGTADVDARTGAFRIACLTPGPMKLKAFSKLAGWVDGPSVDIRAGETSHGDVVYAGPRLDGRITVNVRTSPFYEFAPDPESIVLRGPNFPPRSAVREPHGFVFESVPPGRYTLEIADEKFQPWTRDDVEPGSNVEARLEGSAGIRLTVLDPDGQPVTDYTVETHIQKPLPPNTWSPPADVPLRKPKQPLPQEGIFRGLIPVDQTLVVRVEGWFADRSIELVGLLPNEIRDVTARLSTGARLSGVVLQGAARRPVPGIKVFLLPPILVRDRFRVVPNRNDPQIRTCTTDAAGRFAFSMLPEGDFDLRAERDAKIAAEVDHVRLGDREARDGLELVFPDVASAHGRLLGPEGADYGTLALVFRHGTSQSAEPEYKSWLAARERDTRLAPDGTYRTTLEAGEFDVRLQLPEVRVPSSFQGWSGSEGPTIRLGNVTLPADADVEQDFDLRESFPGSLRLTATVNGAPASDVFVELHTTDADRGWTSMEPACAGTLDSAGVARFGPLPIGEYRLLLRTVDSSWFYFAPETVRVLAGTQSPVAVDVPLVEGDLALERPDSGEAFASGDFVIRLEGDSRSPTTKVRSDGKGILHLRMAAGRYEIRTGTEFKADAGLETLRFEWTASGPAPKSLALWPDGRAR